MASPDQIILDFTVILKINQIIDHGGLPNQSLLSSF